MSSANPVNENDSRTYRIAWLVASMLGLLVSFQTLTFDQYSQSYFLLGIDSFYHGARVQAVAAGLPFYEWDTRGYFPDGAWVAWPWMYDWVLGQIARALALTAGISVGAFAAHLPPIWIAVNLALLALLCRQCKLKPVTAAIVMLSFALLPTVQQLHLAGRIDHHFAELSAVLLVLLMLIRWTTHFDSASAAMLTGLALAFGGSISNGLFVLQAPVLMAVALLWLSGSAIPLASALSFSAGLIAGVGVAAIFSEPFWQGEFHYYVLSAFHLYVASISVMLMLLLALFKPSAKNVFALAAFAGLLCAPIALTALHGLEHLAAARFSPMETEGLFDLNVQSALILYSPLLILTPASLIALYYCRLPKSIVLPLATMSAFGFLMLVAQTRFAVYGVIALVLPIGAVLDHLLRVRVGNRATNIGLMLLLGAMGYTTYVALPHHRIEDWNPEYFENLTVFRALGELCQTQPGLALVHPNQGHYVLYHSNCSVLANNSTISERHLDAREQTIALLNLSPEQLLKQQPDIQYVALTRYDGTAASESPEAARRNKEGLHGALLAAEPALPSRYSLLGTVGFERGSSVLPLSRLFVVAPLASSVNRERE